MLLYTDIRWVDADLDEATRTYGGPTDAHARSADLITPTSLAHHPGTAWRVLSRLVAPRVLFYEFLPHSATRSAETGRSMGGIICKTHGVQGLYLFSNDLLPDLSAAGPGAQTIKIVFEENGEPILQIGVSLAFATLHNLHAGVYPLDDVDTQKHWIDLVVPVCSICFRMKFGDMPPPRSPQTTST